MTGASGFVGRHVVPQLLAHGHIVRVLLRNPKQQIAGAECIFGDLHNETALGVLCRGADVMLHMAGAINGLALADFMRVNVDGTENVLTAMRRNGVKRIVHLSSLAAREPSISHYAMSKQLGEAKVVAAQDIAGLILRPAAVYGEGDAATLPLLKALMSQIAVLPGTPTGRFSMIYAADLASVCAAVVNSNAVGLREIDDGEGGYAWPQIAEVTRQIFGYPRHIVYLPNALAQLIGLSVDVWAKLRGKPQMISSAKMKELYFPNWVVQGEGWPREHRTTLGEGMKRTLLWYMQNSALPRRSLVDRTTATPTSTEL